MKLLTSLAVALPLVSARRLAPRGEVVSYDGYKVVRVDTHTDVEAVESRIASLHTVNFNPGTSDHLDLAVGPEDVETFEALGLDYKVVHEDLGADIKLEGTLKPYSGKDDACPAELPHMDWFDSYHPYEDHLDFIKDLHLAFPKNSEIVHVGESYEGRDIVGIHFWGEGGRGSKPAVYWHGTVHAREWITTMVSLPGAHPGTGPTDTGNRPSNTSPTSSSRASSARTRRSRSTSTTTTFTSSPS